MSTSQSETGSSPKHDSTVLQQQHELQLVPEVILKRKHDLDEMKAHRAAQQIRNPRGNNRVFSKNRKEIVVTKPEKILARARSKANMKTRYTRVLKKGMQTRASKDKVVKSKKLISETDGKEREAKYAANSVSAPFVFVIRLKETTVLPYKTAQTLKAFRLHHANEGVFLKLTPQTQKWLHLVAPFVVYGIPSKATVTDLIVRRGHGRINKKRIPLSDNVIVEKALGDKTGIICIDDLVHEICSAGTYFKEASSFLWPFRLTSPKSKFQKKVLNEKDGKEYGDKGDEINDIIHQML